MQVVLIGFMTPGLSAGAISGERERQTLNILLTTQLNPFSIVLSKLVTSLSFIGLLVFMSLPLYSFVFLFGGISPDQLFKIFFFYIVNILFFGCLGLFCSSWIKRTGVSTVTAYGFSFLVGVGTALLFAFMYQFLRMLEWNPESMFSVYFVYSINPIFALLSIFGNDPSPNFAFTTSPWIVYTLFYTALSVLLIAWSTYLLQPIRRRFSFLSKHE